MKKKNTLTAIAVMFVAGATLAVGAPLAQATDATQPVSSVRSFPKVTTVKKDYLAESTSTKVDDNSKWGGIETVNVPKTKSTAEKEQEAAAKQAEEQAKAEQQAQAEAAAAAAAEQAQAASRSEARESLSAGTDAASSSDAAADVPATKNGAALASFASRYVGHPYVYGGNTPAGWDCTGFTQWVFSQFGKNIGRVTYDQINAGKRVTDPQPGDLMISTDMSHAGIYLGNGMMVHAANPGMGTAINAVASVIPSSYIYVRVL